MKATVQGWAVEQLYHHCIVLNLLSTRLHQIKKAERKKSNQTEWLDKARHVNVAYLEFCKDFDIIFQSILLEELAAHGLDWCTILWVHSGWVAGPREQGWMGHNQRVAGH